MRRLLPFFALLLFLPIGYGGETPRPMQRAGSRLRFVPVPVSTAEPGRVALGALRYRGGWRLESDDRAFGGWSGMVAAGDRLLLVSDVGGVLAIRLANGRPVAAAVGDLPDGPGDDYFKRARDAEALTRDPATGRLWVGFEQRHSVWRYAPGFARAEAAAFPPAMRTWPTNGGTEALVRLRDGRFLVFAEIGRAAGGDREILIFAGDPTRADTPPPALAFVRPAKGYRITAAAQLPDGRLLLLERRFRFGFRARLVIADPARLRPGRRLPTRLLARFAPPVLADNFEGLAVTRQAGETIVWILSDDNFMAPQRTLLLSFALPS